MYNTTLYNYKYITKCSSKDYTTRRCPSSISSPNTTYLTPNKALIEVVLLLII